MFSSSAQQPASYSYGAPAQASTGYGAPQQHYHQPAQHQPYYPAPAQTYQPHYSPAPVAGHSRTHKLFHGSSGSHGKSNASAMSALTLLAFMFFLNILQSCLKEHMLTMNPTVRWRGYKLRLYQFKLIHLIFVHLQVMVMTAGAGRRAAFKSNLDLKLPNDAADGDDSAAAAASASTASSAEEAATHRSDYSIYTPDGVDGKMFVDEFESSSSGGVGGGGDDASARAVCLLL